MPALATIYEKAIEDDKYFDFTLPCHYHIKVILIEKLSYRAKARTETFKKILKNKGKFWIKKLKTVIPNELNQKLK